MIQGMKQGMVASPAMQLSMRALQANQAELQELIAEALAKKPAHKVKKRPGTRREGLPTSEYRVSESVGYQQP